jgi:hypothetical protein
VRAIFFAGTKTYMHNYVMIWVHFLYFVAYEENASPQQKFMLNYKAFNSIIKLADCSFWDEEHTSPALG